MIKELKSQIARMTFVLMLMLALGAWQYDFVISAINSNIFLNLTIFGTFAFGVFLVYRDVFRLENEVYALSALQEEYEDVSFAEEKEAADPLWRYYRCNELAQIYKRPSILAHAHLLISEQIARHRSLTISPSTMSTLVDGVDARLDDQKSLQQYVTGLLVFLGLIGTFVGLMATLSSVGDIIGALDLTSGDPTATIQRLMDNLKAPLKGMATGFSSSLFGLVTSLTLGMMARFAAKAANNLRMNFEGWLADVARIDENAAAAEGGSTTSAQGGGVEERQLQLLFKVARHTVSSNGRVRASLDQLTQNLTTIVEESRIQRQADEAVIANLSQLAEQQSIMVRTMDRTASALQTRDDMTAMLNHLEGRVADRQLQMHQTIEAVGRNLENLAEHVQELQVDTAPDVDEAMQEIGDLEQEIRDLTIDGLRERLSHEFNLDVTAQAGKAPGDHEVAEDVQPAAEPAGNGEETTITITGRERSKSDSIAATLERVLFRRA